MKTKERERWCDYDRNIELLRLYREGDASAGEELAELNRALVYKIAGKFYGRGVELEELASAGNIGLVKAMNTFDFDKGCAFSTYAVPLIFGEIRRFLRDDGIIKVSRENKRLSAALMAERERRISRGRDASLASLASSIGVSIQDAAVAIFSTSAVRSLDESAFDDDDSASLGSTVYDEDEELREFDKLSLRLAIEKLGDFERRLILLRYFRDYSQSEVARVLGLSQVKVSRIEKKIIASLRSLIEG